MLVTVCETQRVHVTRLTYGDRDNNISYFGGNLWENFAKLTKETPIEVSFLVKLHASRQL